MKATAKRRAAPRGVKRPLVLKLGGELLEQPAEIGRAHV